MWYSGSGSLDAVIDAGIDEFESDRSSALADLPQPLSELADTLGLSAKGSADTLVGSRSAAQQWEIISSMVLDESLKDAIRTRIEIEFARVHSAQVQACAERALHLFCSGGATLRRRRPLTGQPPHLDQRWALVAPQVSSSVMPTTTVRIMSMRRSWPACTDAHLGAARGAAERVHFDMFVNGGRADSLMMANVVWQR